MCHRGYELISDHHIGKFMMRERARKSEIIRRMQANVNNDGISKKSLGCVWCKCCRGRGRRRSSSSPPSTLSSSSSSPSLSSLSSLSLLSYSGLT